MNDGNAVVSAVGVAESVRVMVPFCELAYVVEVWVALREAPAGMETMLPVPLPDAESLPVGDTEGRVRVWVISLPLVPEPDAASAVLVEADWVEEPVLDEKGQWKGMEVEVLAPEEVTPGPW